MKPESPDSGADRVAFARPPAYHAAPGRMGHAWETALEMTASWCHWRTKATCPVWRVSTGPTGAGWRASRSVCSRVLDAALIDEW